MIISSTSDYRRTAEQRLPPFLFHDMDDGAYAENTLRRNVRDLADVALRQLLRKNMSQLNASTELFGEKKMRIAMALTSANKVANITEKCLNKKQ